jgi:mRNA interferase MazF
MANPAYIPDSGDIIWLNLDPRTGHEQSGRRPTLVLSSREYTKRTGLAVVCPITSKIKGLPFEIVLKDTKTAGAILPIHVRSVDVEARHAQFIETLSPKLLTKSRKYVWVIIGAGE